MAYEQIKTFNPKNMGTQKGWCLANVAKGFGIYPSPNPSPSAKADMEINKKKGTLHPVNSLPDGVAVPVYLDTSSIYEHVVVYDKGVWWSDGKRINRPASSACFGWGEWCNGYQIVKYKENPSQFLPTKGWWGRGDWDARVGRLCNFYAENFYGYFCRNKAQAHAKLDGNLFGKFCEKWTKEFQRRVGLNPDGYVGKLTYAELKKYGFKG